eukprot:TRINITY_DN10838_c0_g1_i1.p1 TRINITY_DN10838_c0_g1~~TRINITY_DN10838_c0_g1_i1.p1  ORF type:complete len:198 (+),score=29.52 TRINITY_DN10838_c0_g1_i1:316-909(+)
MFLIDESPCVVVLLLSLGCLFIRKCVSKCFERANSDQAVIRAEISRLTRRAKPLLNPSTFAQHSKIQRQIDALENKLARMEKDESPSTVRTYLSVFLFAALPFVILPFMYSINGPAVSITTTLHTDSILCDQASGDHSLDVDVATCVRGSGMFDVVWWKVSEMFASRSGETVLVDVCVVPLWTWLLICGRGLDLLYV